ncbi:hypothetical protein FRB90_004058 [Tulasnella sp. 427]|nr:hypothetical protein FRB90_004058 [Tulasnella sp. 427]
MTKSAQPLVLIFAIASAFVWLTKAFAPDLIFNSPPALFFSQIAGLKYLGNITPDREPLQGVIVCIHFPLVAFTWLAALSGKRDFHLAVAFIGMSFGLVSLVTCVVSPKYASGVLLFGAAPNFLFGLAIFVVGGFGVKDLLGSDDQTTEGALKKEI